MICRIKVFMVPVRISAREVASPTPVRQRNPAGIYVYSGAFFSQKLTLCSWLLCLLAGRHLSLCHRMIDNLWFFLSFDRIDVILVDL